MSKNDVGRHVEEDNKEVGGRMVRGLEGWMAGWKVVRHDDRR